MISLLERLFYGKICGEIYQYLGKGARLPESCEKMRSRVELSYEDQIREITPDLQEYVFGKERTQAVVAAIESNIALIVAQSHDYFAKDWALNTFIASTRYTFISVGIKEFPRLYRVRESIRKRVPYS